MKRLMAAASAAFAVACAGSASAAVVVPFTAVGDMPGIDYAVVDFGFYPDPFYDELVQNRRLIADLSWAGGNIDTAQTILAIRWMGYANFWDDVLQDFRIESFDETQICGFTDGCLQLTSATSARARVLTAKSASLVWDCPPIYPSDTCYTVNYFGTGSSLYASFSRSGQEPVSGTLALAVTAVPEPGAWALMIVGFAGAGIALRRERDRAPRIQRGAAIS